MNELSSDNCRALRRAQLAEVNSMGLGDASMDEDRSYQKMQTEEEQIRYEFTNQDSIVLRKSGAYYKAVGNSAILLKIYGGKTKIRSSYKPFYGQEVLEMSLHQSRIEETKRYLETLSKKILRDDKTFYIVRLKEPVSAKRIKNARTSNELKAEVTEDILLSRRYNTPLSREVRIIFKEVSLLVQSMKAKDSTVLGTVLLTEALDLQRAIRALTRTSNCTPELKQDIADRADDLLGTLLVVPDFTLYSQRLSRIGRSANSILMTVTKKE